jgi:hypothetical protein
MLKPAEVGDDGRQGGRDDCLVERSQKQKDRDPVFGPAANCVFDYA